MEKYIKVKELIITKHCVMFVFIIFFRSIIFVVILSTFYNLESSGQVAFWGRCPPTTPQANFDLNKYLGRWYEIRSYPAIFQFGGECVTADYSLNPNNTVKVVNRQIRFGLVDVIEGNAVPLSPGKLVVSFPSVQALLNSTVLNITVFNTTIGNLTAPFQGPPRANYIVLGTDYERYAVVHTCTDILWFGNYQFSWILSRTPQIDFTIEWAIKDVLKRNQISSEQYKPTRQLGCS
jgi:apolipoprotein D and lipocalin family protein